MELKKKSCHACEHIRVCYLYLKLREDPSNGVFFKDYKIQTFAEICDNYKDEEEDEKKWMRLKTIKDKPDQEKINLRNTNSDCFTVKIQCPICGSIFIPKNNREWFCETCNRNYTEDEIRAYCGL